MTKFIFKNILLIISSIAFLSSCKYNKFDPIKSQEVKELPKATHTIADLKALYKGDGKGTTITKEIIIRGIVSTNDAKGNFYRTINIQDNTGGIEVKMGMANISLLYPQGYEVAIHCKDLVLGQYGEVINLGFTSIDPKYETGYVPELMVPKLMQRGEKNEIKPIDITIEGVKKRYANMLVKLDNVQFIDSELLQTFADPINKENVPAVNRTLINKEGETIAVRTSSYAAFAGKKLPQGSGSVTALLTYFRSTPQLVIIDDQTDLSLSNPRFKAQHNKKLF